MQVRELVLQSNKLGAALEDLTDENTTLRQRAGLAPGEQVDSGGVRMAREVALAQLRSVNALLERQVGGRGLLLGCLTRGPQSGKLLGCWGGLRGAVGARFMCAGCSGSGWGCVVCLAGGQVLNGDLAGGITDAAQ